MAAARKTAASVQREFDAFKARVVEVAKEAQEVHGWCNEVDNILDELGLEVPKRKAKITVEMDDVRQYEDYVGDGTMTASDLQTAVEYALGGNYGDVDLTVKVEMVDA